MITIKYASMIAVAAFVAGSFVASPELRAFAANTVGSADIINNSIQSVDIKDGEVKTDDIAPSAIGSLRIKDNDVKAQDIAPDAVGPSELQGVSKLIFADCNYAAYSGNISPGQKIHATCPVSGIDPEDEVLVMDHTPDCFSIANTQTQINETVLLHFVNDCPSAATRQAGHVSIMVYDELPDKPPIPFP